MSNNKQRPTAEAIENAEAFIQERFGGTSPDFAKIITVKNIKLSHLLAEYKALDQMEQKPVSTGERMSAKNFLKEELKEDYHPLADLLGITLHATDVLDYMERYAAQQCAIVAAEKDKEIKSRLYGWSQTIALLKERDGELTAKEAECQRLREAVIEARKLILKFHIPFSTGDEETYTEKVFKPFKELCQPQSPEKGEQKG